MNSQSAFDLICTDAAGVAHPLPELGPLPLFPEDDGCYSVLGPALSPATPHDQANGSGIYNFANNPINISATITHPNDKVFCGSPRCSGNSGPHTCSRRSYTCNAPDCTRPTPFKTKQALNRHYELIHLGKRIDCPVPGFENVGEKGVKRYDNLVAHVRNKHGEYQLVDFEGSTWLIRRAVG